MENVLDRVLFAVNHQFATQDNILVVEDEMLLNRKDLQDAFKALQ
jgi:hypothetical protein